MSSSSVYHGYGLYLRQNNGKHVYLGIRSYPDELRVGSFVSIDGLVCRVIKIDEDGLVEVIPYVL